MVGENSLNSRFSMKLKGIKNDHFVRNNFVLDIFRLKIGTLELTMIFFISKWVFLSKTETYCLSDWSNKGVKHRNILTF